MNHQPTYFVTGASGFVGSAVVERLASMAGCTVMALVRRDGVALSATVYPVKAGMNYLAGEPLPLSGVDILVHCAARVHVMSDASSDPLTEYRKINVAGTLKLAEQAAQAGVKRFVFISSIKVNGERTRLGQPYTADDVPSPGDPYGVSKMEAEQQLRLLAQSTGMEVVVIRPVLVYGPGVKANFRSMMSWLNKGVVLPLGAIGNKRSLVALDNLVDLIVTCMTHPAAAGQTFLASDGEDLSTTELLRCMGAALGKPARLLPVPAMLLEWGAALIGRKSIGQRLCGSLQVDITKARDLLGWVPPTSVSEALKKTAASFKEV
ncbi:MULTISPECIES: SDR family oxidoreductase [unclassified Pseudomonas]|uniref:UDP-glucose 4-epimerase family protein n=1 Tax=unclassified Pseudomonas TaxID=196821 RepID=UPI0011A05B0F|nr:MULTISPECIES: SDR family oxidoreductase [unclassified Pseudomonas]MBB6287769.1 nucleoside-diphosphate-sugar epimerase [Pseudomonas sp. SJZ073]MBB6312741.1 nucleoside-diphosphate-sugar epimerase [Pseudomonas sp. JAI120]MCS4310744.1 nucleoside-diphosphate-sugar epimerase [Pseudomonas sp. BIGb0381]